MLVELGDQLWRSPLMVHIRSKLLQDRLCLFLIQLGQAVERGKTDIQTWVARVETRWLTARIAIFWPSSTIIMAAMHWEYTWFPENKRIFLLSLWVFILIAESNCSRCHPGRKVCQCLFVNYRWSDCMRNVLLWREVQAIEKCLEHHLDCLNVWVVMSGWPKSL